MTEFLIALGIFLAAHLIPARPRLRARLIGNLGRSIYPALYSALSFALIGWLIVAARRAESPLLWAASPWQWHMAVLLMTAATILLVAGLLASNPLSIAFRPGPDPDAIAAITRHPVLWAFFIWAMAHIPPNGDLVSVVPSGGIKAFSLLGFAFLNAKARRRLGEERWSALAGKTPVIPFAALLTGRRHGHLSGRCFGRLWSEPGSTRGSCFRATPF